MSRRVRSQPHSISHSTTPGAVRKHLRSMRPVAWHHVFSQPHLIEKKKRNNIQKALYCKIIHFEYSTKQHRGVFGSAAEERILDLLSRHLLHSYDERNLKGVKYRMRADVGTFWIPSIRIILPIEYHSSNQLRQHGRLIEDFSPKFNQKFKSLAPFFPLLWRQKANKFYRYLRN